MLLESSSPAYIEFDDEPLPPEPRKRWRSPKPRLTRAEGDRSDARVKDILERHGFDFRPAQETALMVLATRAVHLLSETVARPIFATPLRRRAAEWALSFDAFRENHDLQNLRMVGLRPLQGKALPGDLDKALETFARDYDRHVGRLVTAGIIAPLLSVIHIRYDVVQGLWDIHMHALWKVADDKIEAMRAKLTMKFFDIWMDGDRVEHPGGAANYCVSWTIDHRQIMTWPEEAILELWNLPRTRLIRPAGAFRVCRRTHEGMVLRRAGERVLVEERPDRGPRRKATKRPAPTVEGGRVVNIGQKKVAGGKALCAVVKAPRGTFRSTLLIERNPSLARTHVDLAYGEYRGNSPSADPARVHLPPDPEPVAPSTPPVSPPGKSARKLARVVGVALPPRKAWMLASWPPGPLGRLPRPIARRLTKPTAASCSYGTPQCPGVASLAPVLFRKLLGSDTIIMSDLPAGWSSKQSTHCALIAASLGGSLSMPTSSTAVIKRRSWSARSMIQPTMPSEYARWIAEPVPNSVHTSAGAQGITVAATSA